MRGSRDTERNGGFHHVGVDNLTTSALAPFDECQEDACGAQKATAGEITKKVERETGFFAGAWKHLRSAKFREEGFRRSGASRTDRTPLRAM